MKLIGLFIIYLICFQNIKSSIEQGHNIFEIIKSTNGNIFSQMRNMKKQFNKDIQVHYEKTIKEYESLYLSDKQKFVDFILDKYLELKQIEEVPEEFKDDLSHPHNQLEEIKHEVMENLKEFITHYKSLSSEDRIKVDELILKEDPYTQQMIQQAKEHHIIFDDEVFGGVDSIIESLPKFLLHGNNHSLSHNSTESPIKNNSTQRLNPDFKSFLDKIKQDYNLHELHNEKNIHTRKKKIEQLTKSMESKHKEWYMSFLQEYIQEAVVDNEDFKEQYTINKMSEIDLSTIKKERLKDLYREQKIKIPSKRNQFRFKNKGTKQEDMSMNNMNTQTQSEGKNQNLNENKSESEQPGQSENSSEESSNQDQNKESGEDNLTDPESMKEGMKEDTKILKDANNILKGIMGIFNKKRKMIDEKSKVDLSGSCDEQQKKLQLTIKNKMEVLDMKKLAFNLELKELPRDMFEGLGSAAGQIKFAAKLLISFITKLGVLLVKHIPFYFFKFCIPPGPLTFGCCPEAGFFPQQLYNVFTVFEKVDQFKAVAKSFPDWLSQNKHEDFKEIQYMMCAQGYFSVHESALFNICNPMSIPPTQLNLMGMINGDLPLCFFSCLLAMAMCLTYRIDTIGPCDAIVNINTIIAAIFSIPGRMRLMMAFTRVCTYIPFLIRWDILPAFPFGLPEIDLNVSEPGEDCANKDKPLQPKAYSAFEQEYLNQDPNAMNFINQIRDSTKMKKEKKRIKRDRGVPVKRSSDEIVKVDLDADFKLWKVAANSDSSVDVISNVMFDKGGYSPDNAVYHILKYSKDSSKEKEKDFPFHAKRIVIKDQ
jgi:hypothetical protein